MKKMILGTVWQLLGFIGAIIIVYKDIQKLVDIL